MLTPRHATARYRHTNLRPRTEALLLALLLSMLLLLAGCMGGDDADSTDTPSPEATTASIPPPAATAATPDPVAPTPTSTVVLETPTPEPPTPSPTPVDTRTLTLAEGLFTLNDLPTGYYQRHTAAAVEAQAAGEATHGICDVALTGPAAEVTVARVWERTLNGPFVRQELLWLPDDPELVSAWLRERRLAARACDSWVGADGSTSEVTILRRPVFASGSPADALAVRVITTATTPDAHPIDLVSVIIVADHIATITTLIDLGADVDQALALSLAEIAYDHATTLAEDIAADSP